MKIDVSRSKYHPREGVRDDFTSEEVDYCEVVLRRLRFLEHQIREGDGVASGNGGGVFARLESKALVWLLTDAGYLPDEVSGNTNKREKTPL